MKIIQTKDDKNIWLENFLNDKQISFPFNNKPFVCIIWNNREDFVSPTLIEKILKANCKYFVAGGKDCEKRHDYADEINISLYPNFNPPDSKDVMTTWHEKESLKEVIWFALNNTNFDNHDFKNYLLIQIDTNFPKEDILKIINDIWE